MLLNGVIDAAVNGGVQKYVDAFFSPEWISNNPDQIKNLKRFQNAIKIQINVLAKALEAYKIHGSTATKPHCEHLSNLFEKMKLQLSNIIKEDLTSHLKENDKEKYLKIDEI
jgi:dedicator of cytokinesis protein 3